MENHLFTLAEARSALPLVQRIALDIQTTVRDLSRINGAIGVLMGAQTIDDIAFESQQQAEALLDKACSFIEELQEIGAELKGLDPILVDFRSLQNGILVNLCWEIGEDDIRYWHTIDGGYAGRQEL
ncbi:DUF2203 domain-containing protein [bacterium]|nr:DUF2203 domain-containing protein [bacterium]MBU1637926.1 DUF2203 domain-containing protein [bacterium]MBU1921216.1 DUF2203 domain-containing protein [bacterium]